MAEGRALLESNLGQLLGFDDGASDVLEHLLTIESRDDLVEYLTQLLGDRTSDILAFVENVGKFKNGKAISIPERGRQEKQQIDRKLESTETKQSVHGHSPTEPPIQLSSTKQTVLQGRRNPKPNQSRVPPPKKATKDPAKTQPVTAIKPEATQKEVIVSVDKEESKTTQQPPRLAQKSRPARGKATKVCGCFGNFHKPLTNCLYCGRISCSEEGYDFCPFCGYMVEEVVAGEHLDTTDESWMQKERLLRFDREFARRTEILDDQADFQGPSTWMDAEETAQAKENERKRLEALKRPKQVLNLAL